DLYTLDVKSGALKRLTTDGFAEIQPAWSPDGSSIAFATDRFNVKDPAQPASATRGAYQLALMDLASGGVRQLPGFEGARNIAPQWAPGGHTLYFISDRNGIANVYRLDLASGEIA